MSLATIDDDLDKNTSTIMHDHSQLPKNEIEVERDREDNEINGKSKRKYDIIVFGASGFTGVLVVKEMRRFSQIYDVSWAVAGRDVNKLQKVLDDVYKTQDGYENQKIDIVIADVQSPETLTKMVQAARVIINCVGPYYMYGEIVVKSCILNSTHYLDITTEPLFTDQIAYTYNNQAEVNNSLVISTLGLESVPNDLGVEFLFKHFHGELQQVDTYMKFYSSSCLLISNTLVSHGTWSSVLMHLATKKQRWHYRNLLDKSIGLNTRPKPHVTKLLHRRQINMRNNNKEWCFAFPEPDQAVIARSLHHAKTVDKLPYYFKVRNYMSVGGLTISILALFAFVLLTIVAKFECLRNLFIRFPTFFSLGIAAKPGPKEKAMEDLHMTLTLIGQGSTSKLSDEPSSGNSEEIRQGVSNTRKIFVEVRAKNAGYGFTSKSVSLAAITILKDDNLPKGGVLTPASAFRNTQFINRLIEHDAASFEIASDIIVPN